MTGFVSIYANLHNHFKTSQELQMLSRSLSECQSLNLKVMIREGVKKSKWKFKMAFAIRGRGGVLRWSRLPLSYFEK